MEFSPTFAYRCVTGVRGIHFIPDTSIPRQSSPQNEVEQTARKTTVRYPPPVLYFGCKFKNVQPFYRELFTVADMSTPCQSSPQNGVEQIALKTSVWYALPVLYFGCKLKNVQPLYGEPSRPAQLFVIKSCLTSPNQLTRTWQRALQHGCSAAPVNSLVQLFFYSAAQLLWLQVGSERRLIVASSSSATVPRINASASPWTTEVPEMLSPVPLPLFRPGSTFATLFNLIPI